MVTSETRRWEMVHELHEFEEWNRKTLSFRRVQDIYLYRDGEIRRSRADLGPAIAYPGIPEFRIVSLGEDTVAEVVEQALAMRSENKASKILEERGPSTLIDDYRLFKDEMREQAANRSVFGPGHTKRRNNATRKN